MEYAYIYFRFLINFNPQFSSIVKVFSFENVKVHESNVISEFPLIYQYIFAKAIEFINPLQKFFFVAFYNTKSIFYESFEHFRPCNVLVFTFLQIAYSSSSSIAMYMLVRMGAKLVLITIPRICLKKSS